MALALPGSGPGTPTKNKEKRKRARPKEKKKEDRDLDSDAELEVSAEDLVAADGDAEGDAADAEGDTDGEEDDARGGKRRRRRDEDEDEVAAATTAAVGLDVKRAAQKRRHDILLLRGSLDEEQSRRFDAFHSAVIPKGVIKKVGKDLYDQNIPNNVTSVVAGMVKVFVADVVETAREIQQHTNDPTGPLQPYHLQMARMRLQEQGIVQRPAGFGPNRTSTGLRPRRPLFRR